MEAFINRLKQQLEQPLPGEAAQLKMAHAVRHQKKQIPADARKAGVLALFYEKNAEPYLVLTKRVATHAQDKHSGQMSFPGGQYEPADADMSQTALRETEEEIGIPRSKIQLLGNLTPLYIPVSNFQVYPAVGFLNQAPTFIPQDTEVQAIVETPLSLLQDAATRQTMDLRIQPALTLKRVPYYNIYQNVVWGATAMILSELLEVIDR